MALAFAEACESLRSGRIDFNEFYRATYRTWVNLAQYLLRRWRSPAWFSVEDLVQELIFGAYRSIWSFDSERGVALDRFLVWNAVDKAKKKLHSARGALMSGNQDSNPSNIERPFSSLVRHWEDAEAEATAVDRLLGQTTNEAERAARAASLDEALSACHRGQATIVAVLSCADSLEEAADLLMSLPEIVPKRHIKDWHHAWTVVTNVAVEVAAALEEGEP